MRNRWTWLEHASPDELFLIGGEELSPVYPQPDEITDSPIWTICFPYDMGSASIEHMQNNGLMDLKQRSTREVIRDRDERIRLITERVFRAAEIEQARQRLAHAINEYLIAH